MPNKLITPTERHREGMVCRFCGDRRFGKRRHNLEICRGCGKAKSPKRAGFTQTEMSDMAEKRFQHLHRGISVGDGIYADCIV